MTIRQHIRSVWWWFVDAIDEGARPDYWYAFALCSFAGTVVFLSRLAAEMAS